MYNYIGNNSYSHLLSKQEADELYRSVYIKNGGCHLLQEFDTEMNFSHKLKFVSVIIILINLL